MIFVTGPLFAGKKEAIRRALGWSLEEFEERAVWDVQDLVRGYAPGAQTENMRSEDAQQGSIQPGDIQPDDGGGMADPEALARELAKKEVVIATEIGGGIVPVDPGERRTRENAGHLACLLAARADTVVRVCCGIPQALKGSLPSVTPETLDRTSAPESGQMSGGLPESGQMPGTLPESFGRTGGPGSAQEAGRLPESLRTPGTAADQASAESADGRAGSGSLRAGKQEGITS